MMSTLPDLTPRDSHSLWYTSRQTPTTIPHHLLTPHDPTAPSDHTHHAHHSHHPSPRDRDARRALIERTPLARLRHDEAVMDRRRANVANYATQWLRPPGVAKTLQQIREERREAMEHAEAVERDRQLQALAQAAAEEEGELMGDEDEEVDLDEEVPEGETFGFDGEEDEDMESESEDEELEETELEETENNAGAVSVSPAEEEQVREVRAAEDRLMDRMAREENGASDVGEAFGEEDEAREEMLEEDDLVNLQSTSHPAAVAGNADVSMGMDIDMDADLDGEIPDGDGGDEYEHTDSDEEIDEATREISFAGRSSAVRPRQQLRRSVHRSSLRSRASLAQSEAADLSELLSGEGSSFMDASPYPRRRG